MRTLPLCLLLIACGCGREPESEGRPQDVAKAAFEALKAGDMAPLDPHLMTPEEAKAITGIEIDTAERERWQARIARDHERLDVDWETATPSPFRVSLGPMGRSAVVRFDVRSNTGTAAVEVSVSRTGRRFVFAGLKTTGIPHDERQAAPDAEED